MEKEYRASFGIGYYVESSNHPDFDEWREDGVIEYIGSIINKNHINNITADLVGDVWDENIECILVWNKNINMDSNLSEIKNEIDDFIDKYDIVTYGDYGLIGGVCSY